MDYHQQSAAAGRILLPDLVRAFAILGIVVVNVGVFGFDMLDMFHDGMVSGWDRWATFLVSAFALGKSYTLFSFMFGVGLAYQMQSAARRGVDFVPIYFRRMAGLAILGFIHAIFFFIGDILVLYAIIGCALFAFREMAPQTIRRWATWLLVIHLVILALGQLAVAAFTYFVPDAMSELGPLIEEFMGNTTEVYATGNFFDVAGQRLEDFSILLPGFTFAQGPGVLAFFLFGLYSTKQGYLSDANHPVWHKARRIALPIGLVMSLTGAWLHASASGPITTYGSLGTLLVLIGAPFSTAGYLGLIAAWAARPRSAVKTFLARGGTSTLTAYLLQSIIMSFVFSAYGLGLFQELSAGQAIGLATLIGIFTLILSSLIRTRFKRGLFEWALRRFTYGNMKADKSATAS